MRSSTRTQRGTTLWHRALGRLHRNTDNMRHIRRSPKQRTEEDQLTGPPSTSTGPTDPEVFNARRPTPRPTPRSSPPYDVPANLATITPTQLLDLLHQIEEEGTDIVGNVRPGTTEDPPPLYENAVETPPLPPRPTQLDRPCPSPEDRPERPESTGSLVEVTYVEMASRAGTRGSTVGSIDTRSSLDRSPTLPRSRPRHPSELDHDQAYEELNAPGHHDHVIGERTVPIPQGSPRCQPPVEIPTPIYYKDYANPDAYPAYRLVCHSVWYIQISPEVIVCPECATAEHTFCISNRPLSVWRHMHVLAREFCHTTMHCGRCYKLLMTTRRAIDCYQCRQCVIDMKGQVERLVYKVMCEITVPRTIA